MNFAPGLFRLLVISMLLGSCGRTDLFSARNGSNNIGCPANDPTCIATDGGGVVSGHDGSVTDGSRTDGSRTDGSRTDGKVCPTGNREICGDKIDNDCNGLTDCADPACFGDPSCSNPGQEICNNGIDDNGNGLTDCADPECANSISCRPSKGPEICDNGVDDNGNGLA